MSDCDIASHALLADAHIYFDALPRANSWQERWPVHGPEKIGRMDMSEGACDMRSALKTMLAAAVSVAALGCAAPAFAASCEDLASLKLPDTTIETAQSIPAGDYTTSDKVIRKGMPAFCRVVASDEGCAGFRHPDGDVAAEGSVDGGLPRHGQWRLLRRFRPGL